MKKFLEYYNKDGFNDLKRYWNSKISLPEYYTEDDLTVGKFTKFLRNQMKSHADRFSALNKLSDSESDHIDNQIDKLVDSYEAHQGDLNNSIMADHLESSPFSEEKIMTQPYGQDFRHMFQEGVVSLRDRKIEKQKAIQERQQHNEKVKQEYGITKPVFTAEPDKPERFNRQEVNKQVLEKYNIKPQNQKPPQSPQEVKDNVVVALDRFKMKKSITHKDVFELSHVITKSIMTLERFPDNPKSAAIHALKKSRPPQLDYTRYTHLSVFSNQDKDRLAKYFEESFKYFYQLKT